MGKEHLMSGKSIPGRGNSREESLRLDKLSRLDKFKELQKSCMTRGASIRKGEEGVVSGGEQEPELAGACGAGRNLHSIPMVIGSQQRPLKGEMN